MTEVWLDFINQLVVGLAWPSCVLITVLLLRNKLSELFDKGEELTLIQAGLNWF